MSYHVSKERAVENAGRFIKESGCDSVKLEGGSDMAPVVEAVVKAGIPVCAHIGLTPQTATMLSGFRVQGKDAESARQLVESAKDLEIAGAFMIVMECIPDRLAVNITEALTIPTIGIGAGVACDGQIQVFHDLFGLGEFAPRHARTYVDLSAAVIEGVKSYASHVRSKEFPGKEETIAE